MEESVDMVWSDRPWIGPAVALRTIGVIVAGFLVLAILGPAGVLSFSVLGVAAYVWIVGVLALVWLVSLVGLLIMRASYRYTLRQSSVEVEKGIARKKFLVVSPSAFSELEVDQGIIGRILNYGSLEVRSQGGQQLNLMLIRDPKGVSVKIRRVMVVPTVRIAKDEQVVTARA
jgi:membrane protein YdbS with pleckstrin-like domain